MRFLGHQSRDTRIIATRDRSGISTANTSLFIKSDAVVYDQDVDIHHYTPSLITFASDQYRGAGVHMVGPNDIADEGGTRTLYRVIANGYVSSSDISISLGFGRSPASLVSTDAGNLVGKPVYLSGNKEWLQHDDLVGVDPFPTADEDKSIFFYIYLHNHHSAGASTFASFSLSVARLVGPRPMMHDQRLQ